MTDDENVRLGLAIALLSRVQSKAEFDSVNRNASNPICEQSWSQYRHRALDAGMDERTAAGGAVRSGIALHDAEFAKLASLVSRWQKIPVPKFPEDEN